MTRDELFSIPQEELRKMVVLLQGTVIDAVGQDPTGEHLLNILSITRKHAEYFDIEGALVTKNREDIMQLPHIDDEAMRFMDWLTSNLMQND